MMLQTSRVKEDERMYELAFLISLRFLAYSALFLAINLALLSASLLRLAASSAFLLAAAASLANFCLLRILARSSAYLCFSASSSAFFLARACFLLSSSASLFFFSSSFLAFSTASIRSTWTVTTLVTVVQISSVIVTWYSTRIYLK